jgi:hypothetical protein
MQVEGKLSGWIETSLEGVVWALEQEGVAGYDGLSIYRQLASSSLKELKI